MRSDYFWANFPDEELLKLRIRDLSLKFEDTDLTQRVGRLFSELEDRKLNFKPILYLGDEWFSPESVPAIAIPFYLAHPRLRALEKKMVLEVEGEEEEEFMRLLRHECGHAFDHAFKVSRRRTWVQTFGSPAREYNPENYHPRPYSRNYVQNIDNWYAQSHPDEDFAETFAIWLDPASNWHQKYKKWSALKKLEYVDRLGKEFQNKSIPPYKGRLMYDARTMNTTLKHHYDKRRREYAENYPDFFDDDLFHIFSQHTKDLKGAEKAAVFMKKNRKTIISSIAHWTNERKVTIEELVVRLTERCQELDLVVSKDLSTTLLEISGFLTTLVSNYLFTGHFRRRV
jgi:hypothetical protein